MQSRGLGDVYKRQDYIIILALNEGNKNMVYGILKQSGMDKYVYDERISVW